jgi:aspartate aminotransferase
MPHISKRGSLMPSSPIRKLVPFAEKAEKNGKNVIKLNIGQPDIPTSEKALEAIRNMDVRVIEYAHSAGIESLRRKMVGYYKRVNIDVSFEDILITTGGSEAITLSLLTCFNADDEILVPEPFYANYYSFATSADVKVVPITSTIEEGFRLPPISEFEKQITNKTRGIIICNPNNPRDTSTVAKRWSKYANWCLNMICFYWQMKYIANLYTMANNILLPCTLKAWRNIPFLSIPYRKDIPPRVCVQGR